MSGNYFEFPGDSPARQAFYTECSGVSTLCSAILLCKSEQLLKLFTKITFFLIECVNHNSSVV